MIKKDVAMVTPRLASVPTPLRALHESDEQQIALRSLILPDEPVVGQTSTKIDRRHDSALEISM